MDKIDFNKGMGKIKKRVKKDRTENEKEGSFKCQTINEKLCPFMSNAKYQVACTPQCKIYRASKKGFECRFAELSSISYSLNEILKYFSKD
ncbi:hypothetical protein KAI56_05110 [Candidatus Parcubacteria bacterium]|nr:hypothetical protein [Candidatus Parcubacteria bacterium]